MELGHRLSGRRVRPVQYRCHDQQRLYPHRTALRRGRLRQDARYRHAVRAGLGLQPRFRSRYSGYDDRLRCHSRTLDAQPPRSGGAELRVYGHFARPSLSHVVRSGRGDDSPQRRYGDAGKREYRLSGAPRRAVGEVVRRTSADRAAFDSATAFRSGRNRFRRYRCGIDGGREMCGRDVCRGGHVFNRRRAGRACLASGALPHPSSRTVLALPASRG